MKKEKPIYKRKIKRSHLIAPGAPAPVTGAETMFGTPASSGPMTVEGIAEMERSYEDFLKLRHQRILENVGRDSQTEFTREE